MNVKSIHAVNPLVTLAVVAGLSAWFAEAGAQSTATAASINILEGLITADGLVANVVSSRTASGAASNANGSTFDNLVVAGVPVTSGDAAVDPNTNITLPGVGYVVLNE